jgi:DNA end-binding protein Ku
MAELLVEQMVEDWKPDKYKDKYRDDLLARIREKIAAGETEAVTAGVEEEAAEAGAEVVDIMDLLKRSVAKVSATHVGAADEAPEPAARKKKASAKAEAKAPAPRGRRKTA